MTFVWSKSVRAIVGIRRPNGKQLGAYRVDFDLQSGAAYTTTVWTKAWFGSREVSGVSPITHDRVGSKVGSGTTRFGYYPYGEARTVGGATGGSEFATYTTDSTGLMYADQRYYQSGVGRFASADPYVASGGAEEPGSWNRFAYVGGDPVNFLDPLGLDRWGILCFSIVRDHPEGGGSMFSVRRCIDVKIPGESQPPLTYDATEGGREQAEIQYSVRSSRLTRAIEKALNLLAAKKECRDLFAGSNEMARLGITNPLDYLTRWAGEGLIQLDTDFSKLPSAGTGAVVEFGFSTIIHGVRTAVRGVNVNYNGFIVNGGYIAGGVLVGTTQGQGMDGLDQVQAGGAAIIHEMLHLAGIFGPDIGPGQSAANSRKVMNACF